MFLELHIQEKKQFVLLLKEGRKSLDVLQWEDDNNLSCRLLSAIEKIIHRNDLDIASLRRLKILSDIPNRYTAVRIAKTIAAMFECRELHQLDKEDNKY